MGCLPGPELRSKLSLQTHLPTPTHPHPTPFRIGATNPRLRLVLRPSTRPAASQPASQAPHLDLTSKPTHRRRQRPPSYLASRGTRARHRPIPQPQRPQPLDAFPQSAPLNPPTPPGTQSLHQRQHRRLEKDQRDATKRNDNDNET
ncbi:hypothetical protein Purlil1_9058 [Purpureocillium lilacinum]|uniref:Uncharacterized protein n=1 Tax=Purpureocillium lilacinum TaxID=33203 RepID=A0ABR0BRJ2_PURLI|nr:hypothetical protein Purlil1_9058 [Purpureocillium lilacinum]